mgnify:CR=1 FL=1
MIDQPKSKFIEVKCKDCNNEQIIFDKASEEVECLVCGEVLAEPTGGKVALKGEKLGEV